MKCLRCENEMKFLKEYRFDSQDNNRGVLGFLFDIEDHLVLMYMFVQIVEKLNLYIKQA